MKHGSELLGLYDLFPKSLYTSRALRACFYSYLCETAMKIQSLCLGENSRKIMCYIIFKKNYENTKGASIRELGEIEPEIGQNNNLLIIDRTKCFII